MVNRSRRSTVNRLLVVMATAGAVEMVPGYTAGVVRFSGLTKRHYFSGFYGVAVWATAALHNQWK